MSKLTRRKFLTGMPAVAVVAAASVAVAPLVMAPARPTLATLPFGLWRPNLPVTIPLVPREGYIGLEKDFKGRAMPEGISAAGMNQGLRDIEKILTRWHRG